MFFLDNQWMFNLSLILGAVQIIFGMILKAVNQTIQFGFKYAVATIGWILVLVSSALAFAIPGVPCRWVELSIWYFLGLPVC